MDEIKNRYGLYGALFGLEVDVVVNRPMGSVSQSDNRLSRGKKKKCYPINCGYVTTDLRQMILRGTGKEEKAAALPSLPRYVYILGVDEPLQTFRGRIIGVVHRYVRTNVSDTESMRYSYDRLIIAPEGVELYDPDIRHAIAFAERKGGYRLYCMYEKSCGAVVYTVHQNEVLYLLIRNRSGHIGFPKGHVEYGEDERTTMIREIREETSLSVEPDLTFREEYRYVLWNVVHKLAVYSMAPFSYGKSVTTMENEIFGDWLVTYTEARRLLSYENDRKILALANERIVASLNQNI